MNNQAKQFLTSNGIDADKVLEVFNGAGQSYAERIIRDIAGKVFAYGAVSDKTVTYLKSLMAKVSIPVVPVPTGRIEIQGVVAVAKMKETNFGWVPKMLVKSAAGWAVWVSIPAKWSIAEITGKAVRFVATVKASKDDPAFGIGSRPAPIAVLA